MRELKDNRDLSILPDYVRKHLDIRPFLQVHVEAYKERTLHDQE